MFTWPSFLPNPDNDLTAETSTASIRTKMDSGRTRVRRRFTTDYNTFRAGWTLNDVEYAVFKALFYYELKSGTEWFTINLPIGDNLTPCVARFSSIGYNARHVPAMHWKVTAELELQDNPITLTEDTLAALLFLENDLAGFEASNDHLHEVVHFQLTELLN